MRGRYKKNQIPIAILSFVILGLGLVGASVLSRQNQNIEKKAAGSLGNCNYPIEGTGQAYFCCTDRKACPLYSVKKPVISGTSCKDANGKTGYVCVNFNSCPQDFCQRYFNSADWQFGQNQFEYAAKFFANCLAGGRTCVNYKVPVLKIFTTFKTYNGNLGGLAGADQKCQQEANQSDYLKGKTFKAWLSDSKTNAKDRLNNLKSPNPRPYYQIQEFMGTAPWMEELAANPGDLLDGKLNYNLNRDVNGTYFSTGPTFAWTNTQPNGLKVSTVATCVDWTEAIPGWASGGMEGEYGYVGSTKATDAKWTNDGKRLCLVEPGYQFRLYCVQDI